MIPFIQTHWVAILAAVSTTWAGIQVAFNKIANSLPAPTADATPRYIWWFKFVNNMAGNTERAKNLARIEDSPNFIAAAEAYMQKRLQETGKQ
jgi:hypothetical protein